MLDEPTGFRIEVFRTGTFKPMSGDEITYSADDLAGIASSYDPDGSPAPIVIGHPKTDDPAYGWVKGFTYDADADRLYADVEDVEPAFFSAVKEGRYKKVSMSFHTPDAPNNPASGSWYPKHIGFLGAAAPAVSGLKPVELAASGEGEAVVFEAAFGEPGFEDTASLLQSIREFFIEKFGRESADNVLPSYRIEWLSEREISPREPARFADPSEEPSMTPEEIQAAQAANEARAAELDARQAELDALDQTRRAAANATFADRMVDEGKLLPVNRDNFVAILDTLPANASVSFSEGADAPLPKALMDLMEAQPKVVNLGEANLGDEPDGDIEDPKVLASFAAKYRADQAAAGIHISISDAVEHVKKEGAST